MFAAMRSIFVAGLALWSSLALGCSDNAPPKPTREECTAAAEHIAELIIDHFMSDPPAWFEAVLKESGPTNIPPVITKEVFGDWLQSPPGRTWLLQRRGNTLTGVQQGIDPCVENGTKAQVKCLMTAKSKDDVVACDAKFSRKGGKSSSGSADGSSTGSAAGSANGSANGSAASGSGATEIK